MRGVHLTHVGGPTVLIEVGGWRLLTDPTFDAPGRRYAFGWGATSHKLSGPAIAAAWISGDTVLYDAVREVANRVQVDTALLHLGGVQFPVTGPVRYTMTARDAVELSTLIRPRTVIPVRYEGRKQFKQGRATIEREFATATQAFRTSVRWLPIDVRVDVNRPAPAQAPHAGS